jgi:hypothetical protein
MTIHYRDTEPGAYRSVRVWQDDHGMWVLDCERTDGTLGNTEWDYLTLTEALQELPLIYAVQVLGARVTTTPSDLTREDQAQAPARWTLYLPIPGDGEQATVHPNKHVLEGVLRRWMRVK